MQYWKLLRTYPTTKPPVLTVSFYTLTILVGIPLLMRRVACPMLFECSSRMEAPIAKRAMMRQSLVVLLEFLLSWKAGFTGPTPGVRGFGMVLQGF
jgi:hypothetical protein